MSVDDDPYDTEYWWKGFPVELQDRLRLPAASRVYDYYLGGGTNFPVDQEFARGQMEIFPDIRDIAYANRAFLDRAVRHMIDSGIRTFLDIGSGLPTLGNVHEIAERCAPGECSVVYVDIDPVAVHHAQRILGLTGDPARHYAVQGDLFRLDTLWQDVLAQTSLDPTREIGLLLVAVLHFAQPHQRPYDVVADLRGRVAPGSRLAISHMTDRECAPGQSEALRRFRAAYEKTSSPGWYRDRDEVRRFFGDFALVDPGLVWVPEWHAHRSSPLMDDPPRSRLYGAVGVKP